MQEFYWQEKQYTAAVIFENGKVNVGIAIKHPKDPYSKKVGRDVAKWRAENSPIGIFSFPHLKVLSKRKAFECLFFLKRMFKSRKEWLETIYACEVYPEPINVKKPAKWTNERVEAAMNTPEAIEKRKARAAKKKSA